MSRRYPRSLAGHATRALAQDRANSDYIQRFSLWLSGGGIGETTNAHPPQGLGAESSDADIEALHREVFGDVYSECDRDRR